MNDYEKFGLASNPFDEAIANTWTTRKYHLIGRDTQIQKMEESVKRAIADNKSLHLLIMGDYGTGKTHHLLYLGDLIDSGKFPGTRAVYLGSIGLSIQNLYESFITSIMRNEPLLADVISSLPSIKPDESVDPAYKREKLRTNIIENMRTIIAEAKIKNIKGIFLLIDEAEDIISVDPEKNSDELNYFITSLLHMINALDGEPLHFVMGLSREAFSRISSADYKGLDKKLGEPLWQRFSIHEAIILGHLGPEETQKMLIDRLNYSRIKKNESLDPIKKEVIPIVVDRVSGNPREILAIFNKALQRAIELDARTIDGEVILFVLAEHTMFSTKKRAFDYAKLNTIVREVESENEAVGKEFWSLKGRLIGEGAKLKEREFSTPGIAQAMCKPIKAHRLLEKSDQYGETFYNISNELKKEIFYQTEAVHDSHVLYMAYLELMSNPRGCQNDLTNGLWQLIRDQLKGDFISSNKYGDYQIIKAKISSDEKTPPVRFAICSYKAAEFPQDMYLSMIDQIETRQVDFGLIVTDDRQQKINPSFQNFIRSLKKETRKMRCLDNILHINLDDGVFQKDNYLLAKIKVLGDGRIKEKSINLDEINNLIGLRSKVKELVQAKGFPYPEGDHRQIIELLATNPDTNFSIADIKEKTHISSVTKATMEMLKTQNFVVKDGTNWKIAGPNVNTPWKEINLLIERNNGATFEEIKSDLSSKYTLLCPHPDDENRMVQWYMDLMVKQMLVHFDTAQRKYIKEDMGPIFTKAIDNAAKELHELKNRLKDATRIGYKIPETIPESISNYNNEIARMKRVSKPGRKDVDNARVLFDQLQATKRALNTDIEKYIGSFNGRYINLERVVDQVKIKIRGDKNSVLTPSEREQWENNLSTCLRQAKDALDAHEYSEFINIAGRINENASHYASEIDTRISDMQPCLKLSADAKQFIEEAGQLIDRMESQGYQGSVDRAVIANFKGDIEKYYQHFNERNFSEAKKIANEIFEQANTLKKKLEYNSQSYNNIKDALVGLSNRPVDRDEYRELLSKAQEDHAHWELAGASTTIERLKGLMRKWEEKLPEDLFLERLRNNHGSLKSSMNGETVDQVFTYLKQLLSQGKIDDIKIELK